VFSTAAKMSNNCDANLLLFVYPGQLRNMTTESPLISASKRFVGARIERRSMQRKEGACHLQTTEFFRSGH
jgi:hypothetical protein